MGKIIKFICVTIFICLQHPLILYLRVTCISFKFKVTQSTYRLIQNSPDLSLLKLFKKLDKTAKSMDYWAYHDHSHKNLTI